MKAVKRSLMAAAALAICMENTVLAAPLKEDEISVLFYGAFIGAGVLLYIAAGKLFDKFVKRRKEEKEKKK